MAREKLEDMESEQQRCSEAEECMMDGGMTGVMKEGIGDEEGQMDHHDIPLEHVVHVCVHIHSYFPALCIS